MEDPLISFVIPLYNCRPYIVGCLESIDRQGLEESEYEIVVVDDGSTDGGASVAKDYAAGHSNFRLIRKENGGVASARNLGIREARGKYVCLVDADDYLLEGGMKILRDEYMARYSEADMIEFRAHTVDRYYDPGEWDHIREHRLLYAGKAFDYGCRKGFGWSSCTRILKRDFLLEHGLAFKPFRISEDVLFMAELYAHTEAEIVICSLDIYRYVVRDTSAVNSTDKVHIRSVIDGFGKIVGRLSGMADKSDYPKARFEEQIASIRRQALTRLLSGKFSYAELGLLLSRAKTEGILPFPNPATRMQRAANLIISGRLIAYIVSLPVGYVFMPYFKKYVRRN